MIAGLRRRARKTGLLDRIDARVVQPTSMTLDDVEGAIDFVFALAVCMRCRRLLYFSTRSHAL